MSKMAARNKNHASNVNKLYDEVKISEKKRLADLLQSDDDDIDLDNLIASRSSDTRRKSLDIRETVQQVEEKKLRLLKAKKAPPTFFRCIEQPSIIPQLCCSSDPSLKEFYDLFKSSSIDQLELAIDRNVFTEWCSRNSRMLPNEITDAIYGLTCIRNKQCNKVALKSCKILIEMTESKVNYSIFEFAYCRRDLTRRVLVFDYLKQYKLNHFIYIQFFCRQQIGIQLSVTFQPH